MKTLTRLSQKAQEFCELSGYDIDKVKALMTQTGFAIEECETKAEMDDNGVAYNYPYVVFNPYNFDIKLQTT